MCAVSMVTDHYRDRWPMRPYQDFGPWQPFIPPQVVPSPREWADYLELKRKAAEYDRIMSQPDCEKSGVDEWERRMTELVKRALEQQKHGSD